MNIKKILFVLTILILSACEKDEITISKLYLKEVTDPSCYTETYEYNGEQLISYRKYFGERLSTEMKFSYHSNKLITINSKSENGINSTLKLSYGENGLPTRLTNGGSTLEDYVYDQEDNLISKRIYFSDPNFFTSETEYEWENGNIVNKKHFYFDKEGIRHFTFSEELLYDNKLNYTNQDIAFVYILGFEEKVLSKNNLLSDSIHYEYNKNGYPIKYTYRNDNKEYPVLMKYE